MKSTTSVLATLLSAATQTAAHGYVSNLVINGVYYRGWLPGEDPYNPSPPIGVGWETPNLSNGFVSPDQTGSDAIICHTDAKNARGSATVAAGDRIYIQWQPIPWAESHHGPVIDYLANCGESCQTVDKATLEFFKIDGVGLVDDSSPPGVWGDDQMIANGNGWLVEIPETIAPGNYVLRHELIALHAAGSENGAQLYPQCFNLIITGSGSATPSGTLATDLYTPTDPGILVDIYKTLDEYIVPGPELIPDAVSIEQASSAITATGTPTPA
ncbi:lytic polysaccharide monooxygenase auxiliary activity family 9 protein [Aspergillus lucknowensis]|uniref:AA9 family lytic polysaccharide monooxygenase n=1 Tax=Aspergillus lucknowensis TaxID=176173 RepID=A0ABR4M3N6_9EURO